MNKKLYKLILHLISAGLFFRVFLSCGIENYYYLPQVPKTFITSAANTDAKINIPVINTVDFYYFRNYAIFYKIYTGDKLRGFPPDGSSPYFSSELVTDYNYLSRYTDPANHAYSTGIDNVFKNLNFYELIFLGKSNNIMLPMGGELLITFPTSGLSPSATLENTAEADIILNRSILNPTPNRNFINSSELRTDDKNVDVSKSLNIGETDVCVSMYIVAVGYDNTSFKLIFSKPTHIDFFYFAD